MKYLLIFTVLFTANFSFADELDKAFDKVMEKDRFERTLENMKKSLSDESLNPETKKSLLMVFKDLDPEVYKAYMAQEKNKKEAEKKAHNKEKKQILDSFTSDNALLARCYMGPNESTIVCDGDKVYKLEASIHALPRAIRSKTDLPPNEKAQTPRRGGAKAQ